MLYGISYKYIIYKIQRILSKKCKINSKYKYVYNLYSMLSINAFYNKQLSIFMKIIIHKESFCLLSNSLLNISFIMAYNKLVLLLSVYTSQHIPL